MWTYTYTACLASNVLMNSTLQKARRTLVSEQDGAIPKLVQGSTLLS